MCPRTDRLPKANQRVRGKKLSQTSPCVSRFPPFAGDCRKQILFPNWGKYTSSGGPNLAALILAGKENPLFECIRTEMRKGSPEGYNAENGYSQPARKPQTGE